VERLAGELGLQLVPGHRSLFASGLLEGRRVVLALPQTYMNDSGAAVGSLVRYFKLDPATQLVIVHDELDLEPGRVQLKYGGGLAGHNGLRSVAKVLGTQDFWRVRVGIGRPGGRVEVVGWVLSEPRGAEAGEFDLGVELAHAAVRDLVVLGPERAMTRHNARGAA